MESETLLADQAPVAAGRVPHTRGTLLSRILCELAPHETLMLVVALIFDCVAIIGAQRVTQWPGVLLRTCLVAIVIVGMCYWSATVGTTGRSGRWPRRMRLVYLFPMVGLYFGIAGLISFPLHGRDFDYILIATDRLIFGVNPTWWLFAHFPRWPALTEYLMICYSMFFFLPLILAIELYARARRERLSHRETLGEGQLDQVVFIIVYGFLLSYLCYFFLPAVGPRFTLHNFTNLSSDLPGLWLTGPLRNLLDRGEGVLPGMPMAEILSHVTRDAFPSGHTDMTLLTILLAFQMRSRLRWGFLLIGISLIFSTVYLRFHYAIDVIAGAVLAMITLYTWRWVRDRMVALQRIAVR